MHSRRPSIWSFSFFISLFKMGWLNIQRISAISSVSKQHRCTRRLCREDFMTRCTVIGPSAETEHWATASGCWNFAWDPKESPMHHNEKNLILSLWLISKNYEWIVYFACPISAVILWLRKWSTGSCTSGRQLAEYLFYLLTKCNSCIIYKLMYFFHPFPSYM